jgi:RNA polymerase subunit RPABC4/transcription elongation factor Spt4
MGRFPPLLWLLLLGLLLLPTAAGRVLLDLAGGLLLTLLALPVVLGGLGWIGWKVLQSRVRTCEACGLSTMTTDAQCPACGSMLPSKKSDNPSAAVVDESRPASDVTIDIKAEDVDP